eukprot:3569747-Ditylum_brightwellii.AAC.1
MGIVSTNDPEEDKLLQTTSLLTVVKLHMMYTASDGNTTSLKIAIQNDITVSIIFGYPFIKSIKMTIDVANNIAESEELGTFLR